jgi:phosphinothricin acetyltransferase
MTIVVRQLEPRDCAAVAAIYNQGIAERNSTFETAARRPQDIAEWGNVPVAPLVACVDGEVVGWARLTPYSSRPCYAGIAEASVYVDRTRRGTGIGRALSEELLAHGQRERLWKIVGKLFPDNLPSRRLIARRGFREVGTHLRHAQLDGRWRDVLLVELLIDPEASR